MSTIATQPYAIGKFFLSPICRSHGKSHHVAVLSIRRGRGSQSQDNIYTFAPIFTTKEQALQYAASQAQDWLRDPSAVAWN